MEMNLLRSRNYDNMTKLDENGFDEIIEDNLEVRMTG